MSRFISYISWYLILTCIGCHASTGTAVLMGGFGAESQNQAILQTKDLDNSIASKASSLLDDMLLVGKSNISNEQKQIVLQKLYNKIALETGLGKFSKIIVSDDLLGIEYDQMQFSNCPVSSLYVQMQREPISHYNYNLEIQKYINKIDSYKNKKNELFQVLGKYTDEKISAMADLVEKLDIHQRYGNINEILRLANSYKIFYNDGDNFYRKNMIDGNKYFKNNLKYNLEILQKISDLVLHLPLMSPMPDSQIIRQFGKRVNPMTLMEEDYDFIDFVGGEKNFVFATGAGKVIHAGIYKNMGNTVIIDHGNDIKTVYSRLQLPVLVKLDQNVEVMTPIGVQGQSGSINASGQYLSYQILLDDKPINPLVFLLIGSKCRYL